MFLLENLAPLLLGLLSAVAAVNLAFFLVIVYRRLSRHRFHAAKDAAYERYSATITSFLEQNLRLEDATAILTPRSNPERAAIQKLVLSRVNADNARRGTELLFALGMVERWTRQVFGRRRAAVLLKCALQGQAAAPPPRRRRIADVFRRLRVSWVPRAVALARLGNLDPAFVQPMLVEALLDPAAEVRRIAVFSLGRFAYDGALPLLFEQLRLAGEGVNDVSLRTVKAALCSYPLSQVSAFVPCLKHPNPRVRFFALNTAAQICASAARVMVLNKNDFSPEFYSTVLQLTQDSDPDLRAQSADVVQHFSDASATGALRRLQADETEFVRLHAVRASAPYIELMPDLIRRFSDTRRPVREAAVKTVARFGATGIDELYRHLATSSDIYSGEQIAEEIQREGMIHDLVAGLASSGPDHDLAEAACGRMVRMGKTSMLTAALATSRSPEIRVPLMSVLMTAPSPEVLAIVEVLADTDTGVVRDTARSLLGKIPSGGAA